MLVTLCEIASDLRCTIRITHRNRKQAQKGPKLEKLKISRKGFLQKSEGNFSDPKKTLVNFAGDFLGPFSLGKTERKNPPKNPQQN